MKKIFLIGMAGISLALGMMGCKQDADEDDTWSEITDVSQVVGTWKGSYRDTSTEEDISNELPLGITAGVEITLTGTIEESGNMTFSVRMAMTFSGTNIDQAWSQIKTQIKAKFGSGTSVNDTNHSMTYTETYKLLLRNSVEALINQFGTKIKLPAGVVAEGIPEVIMSRPTEKAEEALVAGEENAEKLDFSLVLTGVTADSTYTAVVYDGAGTPLASAAGKAGEDGSISFPFSLVSGEYLVKVTEVAGGSKKIKSYPDVVFAVGLSEVELAWDEAEPVEAEEPVAEDAEIEEAVAEEPVVEEPVADKPEAEKPVAETPVVVVDVEKPVAKEPEAEEPVADEPEAEKPVADKPEAVDIEI
jgi:hypothetical protein